MRNPSPICESAARVSARLVRTGGNRREHQGESDAARNRRRLGNGRARRGRAGHGRQHADPHDAGLDFVGPLPAEISTTSCSSARSARAPKRPMLRGAAALPAQSESVRGDGGARHGTRVEPATKTERDSLRSLCDAITLRRTSRSLANTRREQLREFHRAARGCPSLTGSGLRNSIGNRL